jgi:hypothetical protein
MLGMEIITSIHHRIEKSKRLVILVISAIHIFFFVLKKMRQKVYRFWPTAICNEISVSLNYIDKTSNTICCLRPLSI